MPDMPDMPDGAIEFRFMKKPGGTPYFPDNARQLAACVLVSQLAGAGAAVLSWTGGRRDEACLKAGIEARVVASPGRAADFPDLARRLAEIAGAECLPMAIGGGNERE